MALGKTLIRRYCLGKIRWGCCLRSWRRCRMKLTRCHELAIDQAIIALFLFFHLIFLQSTESIRAKFFSIHNKQINSMQALYNQSLLSTFLMLQSPLNIQVNLTLISGPFLLQLTLIPLWRHRQYLLQFAVYPCRNKRWALIHSSWGHCGCLFL